MKFRLFGGLDCPDTVLAQLSVVSGIPAALVSKLADHVTTIMLLARQREKTAGGATGGGGGENQDDDEEGRAANEFEVQNAIFFGSPELKDADRMEIAQALTALHTLISNMVRFNVPADIAANELSMLGLGTDIAEVVVSSCGAYHTQLLQALLAATPSLPTMANPTATVVVRNKEVPQDGDGAAEPQVSDESETLVRLEFDHPTRGGRFTLEMTLEKSRALLAELVAARRSLHEHNATLQS